MQCPSLFDRDIIGIHYHLNVDVGSAKPGNEIWVLLNRHFVDKNRTDEYISIHAQEDDVSHGSDNPATREYSLKVLNFLGFLTLLDSHTG